MSHRTAAFAFLTALSLGLVAIDAVAESEIKRVAERESHESLAGVVEAVNAQNRMITIRGLKRPELVVVMNVGEDVRNLGRVQVGDRISVDFRQALAVDLKKGGGLDTGAGSVTVAGRAEKGQKPGAAAADVVTVVATIVAIDTDVPSVTLEGSEGDQFEVLVRHPEKLSEVSVGDQVIITYARAMAVSVKPYQGE